MCGIFGVIYGDQKDGPWEAAVESISHRGPDGYGYHIDETIFMGHRRLSIIDLKGGSQPIYNEDRTKCIIFNGEIYNFLELRNELLEADHVFTTRSDTETILHAYEEWGEDCVDRLRGMFAFAIWDTKKKDLFLARDRFGIKPLFYAHHKGRFYFASEMKAILTDPDFPRDIDEEAMVCYFTLSYIPGQLTIFSTISKLMPGHTLTLKDGRISIRKFWDLYIIPERGKSEKFYINGFLEQLEEAVGMHLISDVPLGAFLSGGIDSSAVVAMMSKTSKEKVNTFTIGFGGEVGGYLDERKYALMVAQRYSTNHREYEVLPEPEGLIEKIVRAFDEPFADDSTIPSFFVCEIARKQVTVALSGLGGDEALGGYERYLGFMLRGFYNQIPFFFREQIFRNLIEKFPERSDGHYTINHMKRFMRSASLNPDFAYFGFVSKINPDLSRSFYADSKRYNKYYDQCQDIIRSNFNSSNVAGKEDTVDRAFYCDVKTYLPDDILSVTDRISMHHSLEVRVPYLDHKLFEFCAQIPPEIKMKWFQKKYLFRKAVKPLLPKEVLDHRKQGFIGPMTQWLKKDLKPFVLESLSKKNLDKHGLLNYSTVQKILNEHFEGKEIHDTLIWSLVVFQVWYDLYIEN
jgi:asparagine synthase (glutamine-hydrolysing)